MIHYTPPVKMASEYHLQWSREQLNDKHKLPAGSGPKPTAERKPFLVQSRRIFAPYYELKKKALTCPECGWHGIGGDLSVSEVFEESAIIEYVCPKCSFDIAFTQGPTLEESRANWDDVDEADRAVVLAVEAFRAKEPSADDRIH